MRENEAEIVRQAQEGNMLAIGRLYDLHQEQIFRYIYSRVRHLQLAEDLTGELFTRMVRHLPGFRQRQLPFRAWLYQIARNLIADHYRQQQTPAIPLQEVDIPMETPGTEYMVEQKMSLRRVETALMRLEPEQRDVLLMRFMLGFSLQEAAETLQKSVPAIKATQHRALKNLRAMIKGLES